VRPAADLHILQKTFRQIEPQFVSNPTRGAVPVLTELPLFAFLLNCKASGRAARPSPVGPLAASPDRHTGQSERLLR